MVAIKAHSSVAGSGEYHWSRLVKQSQRPHRYHIFLRILAAGWRHGGQSEWRSYRSLEWRKANRIRYRSSCSLEYCDFRDLVRFQEIQDNSIFPTPMKIIRMLAGILIGVVVSTLICWGLLFFWGIVGLRGQGSLFDTNPTIAKAFFIGWAMIAAI